MSQKKKHLLGPAYWIFLILLLGGIGYSWYHVWNQVSDLEQYTAKTLVSEYVQTVREKQSGKTVTWKKLPEFGSTTPVYEISVDTVPYSRLTLDTFDQGFLGMPKYQVKNIFGMHTYTFYALPDTPMEVNGVALSELTPEEYTSFVFPCFERLVSYESKNDWTVPVFVRYTVSDLFEDPAITGPVTAFTTEDGLFYLPSISEDESEFLKKIGAETATVYSKFSTADVYFWTISQIVNPNTPIYSNMRDSDYYWYSKHTGIEFGDMEFSEITKYTDLFYSIKVKLSYKVTGLGGYNHDWNTYGQMTATYYPEITALYTIKDGKWLVQELIVHEWKETEKEYS